MKVDKEFLLKESKTFCMAPWVELHVAPHGKIFPCCMSGAFPDRAIGDTRNGDTLKKSWNSTNMKKLRLDMLNENKNKLCERCHKYEDLGKDSERTWYNQNFLQHFDRVKHTETDGNLLIYDPPYLDIRFSNICNLRCRICGPELSSGWFNDAKKLNPEGFKEKEIISPTESPEELWEQVESLIPTIERIHFAGGEPLVMEEHYKILELLIEEKNTDVTITYNTNFANLVYNGKNVLDYWKEFREVVVCASLDGMGKRGDYMRKGQQWDKIVENRNKMKKKCPNTYFHITPVVSLMNVFHILDFYKWAVDTEFISPKNITIYLLFEPKYYNIQGLSTDMKNSVVETYNKFFNTYLTKFDTDVSTYVKNQFEVVLNYIQEGTLDIKKNFININTKLDKIRKENFREIFPEIEGM